MHARLLLLLIAFITLLHRFSCWHIYIEQRLCRYLAGQKQHTRHTTAAAVCESEAMQAEAA